jgi:hypothetical protein
VRFPQQPYRDGALERLRHQPFAAIRDDMLGSRRGGGQQGLGFRVVQERHGGPSDRAPLLVATSIMLKQ